VRNARLDAKCKTAATAVAAHAPWPPDERGRNAATWTPLRRSFGGTSVALRGGMRILEARFHPFDRASPTFVVVARVIWEDASGKTLARIEPAPSLERHTAPATMLATLRHLIQMTTPHSFERLQGLRSRFWSFVSVDTVPPSATRAA
jgi:hypothetical protein